MGANDKLAATFHPIQILEVRFEAETPDDAYITLVDSIQADGLDVRWIGAVEVSTSLSTGDPES